MAHLASFFLTVNYGLNAYIRLREKAKNITNVQLLSVSTVNLKKTINIANIFADACGKSDWNPYGWFLHSYLKALFKWSW